MGLSAMLAEEYILIYISLLSYISGFTNKTEQQNITSTVLSLLSNSSADESRNISTAESLGRCRGSLPAAKHN